MYIRRIKKKRSQKAKSFYQYSLVQNTRIGQKVKQENILYLGSEELLADKQNRNDVLLALKARIYNEQALFPQDIAPELLQLAESYFAKYQLKYPESLQGQTPATMLLPPKAHQADYQNVDINGAQVNEVRSFGAEHLCKQVTEQLNMEEHLKACGFSNKQVSMALAAIISRAIFSSSEWKTAQLLEHNSSLCQLLDLGHTPTHKELYAITDLLYHNRESIDNLLYSHITNLFNLQDKLVIFDLSNTYFETSKPASTLAQYGRSKEKRSDCPLVVFTALINAAGFIRHSNIYEGNKADADSLAEMITDLETAGPSDQQGQKPTIVLDAGIATEENLKFIEEKGYTYTCVARSQIKNYHIDEQALTMVATNNGQHVKLQQIQPEGYTDTWIYVQSEAKERKEKSMDEKLSKRFEEQLGNIQASIPKKGGVKSINKVWERIGRTKEKNRHVAHLYDIEVKQEAGTATQLNWQRKEPSPAKEAKGKGVYFIRTNLKTNSAAQLWQVYNTIREVESTFRCLKTDLNIRPVHHQNDQRIQSHIYLTILAYQLVNSIRYQTKQAGIKDSWTTILTKTSTQTIQNIVLPTEKKTIHLRKPSEPIKALREIYQACKCQTSITAIRKYVVYH